MGWETPIDPGDEDPDAPLIPFSSKTVLIAAVAGIVLFAGAAVIAFVVTPSIDDFYFCYEHDGLLLMLLIGGVGAAVGAWLILAAGLRRCDRARWWSSTALVVAFAGLGMAMLGVACLYLVGATWGTMDCSS
jgi:hypothetical protein